MRRPTRWSVRGVLVTTLVALGLLGSSAYAITIRNDRSDSQYTSLANQSAFASVGEFLWQESDGSYLAFGVLINNPWVLTAAHVVSGITSDNIDTMTFTLESTTYHASATYYDSNWNGDPSNGHDIGLVVLDSMVGDVTPASLYDSTNENHRITTVVGYGQTGTGLTRAALSAGTKRAGTNVISLGSVLNSISWVGFGDDTMLVADFDQPGSTGDPTQNLAVPTGLFRAISLSGFGGSGSPRRCRDDGNSRRDRRTSRQATEGVCLPWAEESLFRSKMA